MTHAQHSNHGIPIGTDVDEVMRGFSQIFRRTWLRIPADDRHLMRMHWNTVRSSDEAMKWYAQSAFLACISPCKIVTDKISHNHASGRAFRGYCDADGNALLFWAVWVEGETEQSWEF